MIGNVRYGNSSECNDPWEATETLKSINNNACTVMMISTSDKLHHHRGRGVWFLHLIEITAYKYDYIIH